MAARSGMQMFHPGFLFTRPVVVNVIRDGMPAPVPYSAVAVRLRPQQVRARRCRSISASPASGCTTRSTIREVQDELISFLGASYFRFLGRAPALRPVRARPRDRRGREGDGGVPALPRVLDRAARPGRGPRRHLRPARRPVGDRRLPVLRLPGRPDRGGRDDDAVPAPADPAHRHRAADLDVLRRRERQALQRRLPAGTARFRRPADAHRRGRVDLAAAAQPERDQPSRASSTTTRAASG